MARANSKEDDGTRSRHAKSHLLRRHLILPPEHGAWIWLGGPFLVGVAAAKSLTPDALLCGAAALAAFFARQPATLLVKMLAGRRSKRDLGPALVWLVVDGAAAAALACWLAFRGHVQILLLALPALPVFAWYLWLVTRRAERHQAGVEIVAAGVLSLAGPAGYWASGGESPTLPWILWGVMWFQAAASIVFVQLRLDQRHWADWGPLGLRLRRGGRAFSYSAFNALVALAGWRFLAVIPGWAVVGYILMLADVVEGVLRPALGVPPSRVGIRQGISSGVFVALAATGFYLA